MSARSPFRFPSRLLRAAVAVGALAVAACDSRVVYGSGGDRTAWGSYTARSANDQPLPATIRRGTGTRTEVLAASLELGRDGDCRAWFSLRVTTLGITSTVDRSERCRWTQDGALLRFWWDDETTASGRYADGARVTLHDDADTIVFAR